jgi:hypothetical protein
MGAPVAHLGKERRMRRVVVLAVVLLMVAAATDAGAAEPKPPFTQCPAIGADTSCALLIYVTPAGQVGVYGDPTQGPYDSIEDTLIGVQNDSTKVLTSLPLKATTAKDLFGFDGDGLCTFGVTGCPFGPTGYEGPGVSFANITPDTTSGTVNFSPAVAPGGHTYFSLEEALATAPPFDIEPGPPNGGLVVTPHLAANANEPVVAVNPTNPQNIVVAFNHSPGSGAVRCGYTSTMDGGSHWTGPLDLPIPRNSTSGGGDPALAFTADGTLYFTCLAGGDASANEPGKTTLYGAVLPNGSTKFGPSIQLVNGNDQGLGPDQEYLAAAPSGNRAYVCYTLYTPSVAQSNTGVRVATLTTHSTGSGPAAEITAKATVTAGTHQINPQGCTLSVAPTGRLWAAWWDSGVKSGKRNINDPDSLTAFAAYSDDGGATFGGIAALGAKNGDDEITTGFHPGRRVYIQAAPQLGDERVVAVWEDAASIDSVMQAVRSGGGWSTPKAIASGATQPSLSWGSDGTVVYSYYTEGSPLGTGLEFQVAATAGPAAAPLTPFQASTGSSSELSGLAPAKRFGDYNGVAEIGGVPYGVWTDNSGGTQEVWLAHG